MNSPNASIDGSPAAPSPSVERIMDLAPSTTDGDSTVDNRQSSMSGTDSDTLHSRDETLRASSSSAISSSSNKGKDKATKLFKDADKDEGSGGGNLVGKINNLISTDLANIVEARDFLLVLVYIPLQITLSIIFLYAVLGWRYVVYTTYHY